MPKYIALLFIRKSKISRKCLYLNFKIDNFFKNTWNIWGSLKYFNKSLADTPQVLNAHGQHFITCFWVNYDVNNGVDMPEIF